MLTRGRRILANPAQRRGFLTITAGILILLGALLPQAGADHAWRHGFYTAAALLAGSDIAVRAFRALLNRQISIELLVTLAAGGALIIGETWEAAAVTFLFLLGAYLEARTMRHTRAALGELLDLTPPVATVLRDGQQLEVAPHEVRNGETVFVKPGGRLPVDGVVHAGSSYVDESSITGEPVPAQKEAGAQVFAGTVNGSGLLRLTATGVGADTTLARIIRRVEEAQEAKAPTQRLIERFATWYTPGVILLAAGAWLVTGDVHLALTLLVIGCPGALVISTPVSIVAGIGRAARRGILIKGGEHLERAGKLTALALDKTGTLTEGRPRLTDIIPLGEVPPVEPLFGHGSSGTGTPRAAFAGSSGGQGAMQVVTAAAPVAPSLTETDRLLAWAAVAEGASDHPLARAILEAAAHLDVPAPDDLEDVTGKGIIARLGSTVIAVGNESLMRSLEITVDEAAQQALVDLQERARTPMLVAVGGQLVGVLGVADEVRAEAPAVISALSRSLRHIVMLTGDNERTARTVARTVGIDNVRAGLLPEEKLEAIRELQEGKEVVAMVGDGINDAPALAAADIGIAMGAGGSDVAIETADIALISDDLTKLPEAIRLSKMTLGNIRQNVWIALITVAGLLAGVLMGEVHMAGGMLIHEASVLLVILNAMRLMRA